MAPPSSTGCTRREALALAAASAGALALPRRASASISPQQRKFLFIFCEGGWDTTKVFTPTFEHPDLPVEDAAEPDRVGGIDYVAHPARGSVSRFLQLYGARTAFLNGFEVRSIAHARCRQLLLTGLAETGRDDWPALLAGHSAEDLLLPCLVASGPTYATRYASRVVRLGETGQLSGLLDGSGLRSADMAVEYPSNTVRTLLDQHAQDRAEAAIEAAGDAWSRHLADSQVRALGDLSDLSSLAGEVDLSVDPSREFMSEVKPVLDGLELGLSRCGVIRHLGVNDTGWDTHAVNDLHQSEHMALLFGDLLLLMAALDARSGPSGGGTLADETTLVVLSEMGRSPWYNGHDGKDHWTWTSAMLIGGGIIGDRVLGGIDGAGVGLPVDPRTGTPDPAGSRLTAAHLGASLLALGGVDPEEWLPGATPVSLA